MHRVAIEKVRQWTGKRRRLLAGLVNVANVLIAGRT
jgi:hypothetical protein